VLKSGSVSGSPSTSGTSGTARRAARQRPAIRSTLLEAYNLEVRPVGASSAPCCASPSACASAPAQIVL
jgi:hypothetical protein